MWTEAGREKARQTRIVPLKKGFDETTNDLAYIVGTLMGDGHLDRHRGVFSLGSIDREFTNAFASAVLRQFGRTPHFEEYPASRMKTGYLRQPQTRAVFYSRPAHTFLRTICNEKWVRNLSYEQSLAWVRGAWDSEGSVSRITSDRLRVKFGVKNETFARLYKEALEDALDFQTLHLYHLSSGIWCVDLWNGTDIQRFFESVKPTIERKRKIFLGAS